MVQMRNVETLEEADSSHAKRAMLLTMCSWFANPSWGHMPRMAFNESTAKVC